MVQPADVQHSQPMPTARKAKQSAAERGPVVLNELINGIRAMK